MKKMLFVAAGHAALALGIAGIFLPLLPTTPFVLLASACYMRGSERLHARLLAQPRLGPLVRAYEEGRGIPRRAKAVALAMLWSSIAWGIWVAGSLPLGLAMAACAAAVSAWLLRMPTATIP